VSCRTATERRRLLEEHELDGPGFCTADTFEDGAALFAAVVQQGLEGIVAEHLASTYRSGDRDWLKVKNRSYWRFGQELELARSHRRRRQLI
jgi:ATP-dependent DNA ligase